MTYEDWKIDFRIKIKMSLEAIQHIVDHIGNIEDIEDIDEDDYLAEVQSQMILFNNKITKMFE